MSNRSNSTIAITGLGLTCALGNNVQDSFQSAIEAKDIFRLSSALGINGPKVAEHSMFSIPTIGKFKASAADRASAMGVAAAQEALSQANPGTVFQPTRTGVIMGTGIAGIGMAEDGYKKLFTENGRPHPMTVPRVMASGSASWISMAHNIQGPSFVVSSACSSGTHAIIQAILHLRAKTADVMLAGGTEACLTLGVISAWKQMRVLASQYCRPFALGRDGLMLGEGAAVLVLERLEDAKARGAEILGLIAGVGMSAEASDIVAPNVNGMIRAMEAALLDANISATDIDAVNSHGTGTFLNDKIETQAIKHLFSKNRTLIVSATKSLHGHCLGASPAIEAVLAIESLRRGLIPPIANFDKYDPECELDLVIHNTRAVNSNYVISNSFAFGGLDASLIFAKP